MKYITLFFSFVSIEVFAAAYTRPLVHTADTLRSYYWAFVPIVVVLVGISVAIPAGREMFKRNWAWYIMSVIIVSSGFLMMKSFQS